VHILSNVKSMHIIVIHKR